MTGTAEDVSEREVRIPDRDVEFAAILAVPRDPVGFFGASTGAGAALVAAADPTIEIAAVRTECETERWP